MTYFRDRFALIRKCQGASRTFAIIETICFPISVLVVAIILLHAILTLISPALKLAFGFGIVIPGLPNWFVSVFVSAAIGYLTNYIAIQMLYYPITRDDLGIYGAPFHSAESLPDMVKMALRKSSIIRLATFGFWKAGLLPRNREKVANQIGVIAEERFMTAEAIAQMLPPIVNALMSKDMNGQVRLVGFIRSVVCNNSESIADFIRKTVVGYIRSADRNGLHKIIGEIGRSDAVADALTGSLIKYVQENPDDGVSVVRSLVSYFSNSLYTPEPKSDQSLFGGLRQFARSMAGAAIEQVAEIGYPQVQQYFEQIGQNPRMRQKLKERLSVILPKIADALSDSILRNPGLLEKVVSGKSLTEIISSKIGDEIFWQDIERDVAPHLESALISVLQGISKDGFSAFFNGRHLIAENVKNTIMRMELLDFYKMLDDVMAEHLGAIQVFGFILGGVIGLAQYAVSIVATGRSTIVYLLLAVLLLILVFAKLVTMSHMRNIKG